jgi:hemerythrin-like metal-binding protein
MGLFAWNDAYLLGLALVDNEHRALFAIADQLNEAISRGEGTWAVKNLAVRLVSAITTHFEHEEALMHHYRYPDMDDHADEHRVMAERMLKMKKLLDAGALTIPPDTLPFLRNWMDRHIRKFDQPTVRHIRANDMAVLGS